MAEAAQVVNNRREAAQTREGARRALRASSSLRGLRRLTILCMVLADVVALLIAVGGAYLVRQTALGPTGDLTANVVDAAFPIAAGWLLAITLFNGYDSRLVPAGTELYRNVLHATLAAAGIVGTIVYLAEIELSRAFFLAFFLIGPPLLLLVRAVIRRALNGARNRGKFRQGVLAVGSIDHVDSIARTLHRERWLGYDVLGAVTPDGASILPSRLHIPVLGTEKELLTIAEALRPNILLFTAGATASTDEFRRTAWKLEH